MLGRGWCHPAVRKPRPRVTRKQKFAFSLEHAPWLPLRPRLFWVHPLLALPTRAASVLQRGMWWGAPQRCFPGATPPRGDLATSGVSSSVVVAPWMSPLRLGCPCWKWAAARGQPCTAPGGGNGERLVLGVWGINEPSVRKNHIAWP